MKATRIIMAVLAVLLVANLSFAQDRKKLPADEEKMYVVSAQSGVVNVVEGDVTYQREQAAWARSTSGDELRDGDRIKTGAHSRAEILLTPGCYLRLAENSEFTLTNPHVYQFRIDLANGSAIIEAAALDGPMTVATPKNEFTITKEGLYRFNIAADGRVQAIVRKGHIDYGSQPIKENKSATVEEGKLAVSSFDKKQQDDFDFWSQGRAQDLTAMNAKLTQSALQSVGAYGSQSNMWVYSRACGCFTFLPFGMGFSSPYGWDYDSFFSPWFGFDPFYNYGGFYGYGGDYGGGSWRRPRPTPVVGGGGGGTAGDPGKHHRKPGDPNEPLPVPPGAPHYRPTVAGISGSHYTSAARGNSSSGFGGGFGNGSHSSPSRSVGGGGPRFSPSMGSSSHSTSMSSHSSSGGGGGGHHRN